MQVARRLSGRVNVARKILLDASQKAMETGEYEISLQCRTKGDAFNLRQSCYGFQRNWAQQITEQAISEGRDPELVLNETSLKAAWPSASIRYEHSMGIHWLVISFKRIPTDPSWDDLIKERMIAGPPPRPVNTRLSSEDIYKMLAEESK